MTSLHRLVLRIPLTLMAMSLAFVIVGCSDTSTPPGASSSTTHELPPAGAVPDDVSIFDLELDLVDQAGVETTLADLGGSPMVAAMVYTSCQDVCILVTEQIKAIERQLADVDDEVRYVLFSLDPGRDTPEAMREFARNQKLDLDRWRLLAASEDGVRDLAAVLGVRYQPEENGQIAHSAMIFVIDPAGVVRHRQVGVVQEPGELVRAVRAARQ